MVGLTKCYVSGGKVTGGRGESVVIGEANKNCKCPCCPLNSERNPLAYVEYYNNNKTMKHRALQVKRQMTQQDATQIKFDSRALEVLVDVLKAYFSGF